MRPTIDIRLSRRARSVMSEAVLVDCSGGEKTGQLFTVFRGYEQDMSTGNVIQLSSVGLSDNRRAYAYLRRLCRREARDAGKRIVATFPMVRDRRDPGRRHTGDCAVRWHINCSSAIHDEHQDASDRTFLRCSRCDPGIDTRESAGNAISHRTGSPDDQPEESCAPRPFGIATRTHTLDAPVQTTPSPAQRITARNADDALDGCLKISRFQKAPATVVT